MSLNASIDSYHTPRAVRRRRAVWLGTMSASAATLMQIAYAVPSQAGRIDLKPDLSRAASVQSTTQKGLVHPAAVSPGDQQKPTARPPARLRPVTIGPVVFGGKRGYRMSDGRSEAVIIPAIGRVVSFGLVGGRNFLLNRVANPANLGGWINFGGDKTWIGPQNEWPLYQGAAWPPDKSLDGSPYVAAMLPGGGLWMSSPVSPRLGARIIREFSFAQNGDFVIQQTVEKLKGPPAVFTIWSITQVSPPDAIFLPLNPASAYKGNFDWFGNPDPKAKVYRVSSTLLEVHPTVSKPYKIGVDSTVAAIAAVKDGIALVERGARPVGDYPDGAAGSGFPVELYNQNIPDDQYNELELLGPLRIYHPGDRAQQTVRWSLHPLPSRNPSSPAVRMAVSRLLRQK